MALSNMALDWLLVVSCTFSVLLAVAYIFYSNRLLALLIGYIFHLSWWSEGSDRAWVSLESFQISLLSGKIMVKDLNYYSSNQSFRAVKCQITWKYWIWRTRDDFIGTTGEESKGNAKASALPCRIHIVLDGVEWRLYNRTAAYNDILSRLQAQYKERSVDTNGRPSFVSGRSRDLATFASDPGGPSGKSTPALGFTNSYPPSTPTQLSRTKSMKRTLSLWFAAFKPTFQEILPIDIVSIRGAIVCGNASTPSLLVTKYANARGSYSVVPSKSPHDKYKTSIDFTFWGVKFDFERNHKYRGSLVQHGRTVLKKLGPDATALPFSFSAFSRLWTDQKRSETEDKINDMHARSEASLKDHADYAIVETILETPKLELSYYWDEPGIVSSIPEKAISEPIDVGNGGTAPEFGIDLVVYGGTARYGPWADRQRFELQRLFFPPTYRTAEPSVILRPGDTRIYTAMKVFVELRDTTTFHVPFREPSKDWQYDENKFPGITRKRREGGWLEVHAGGNSTINYVMPWVATEDGYDALMELHLDEVNALSSVNDIRLLSAQSSRILCQLPAPLRWNGSRRWTFDVSFRTPIFHLIRDHVNLLTDLGKDWSSGPLSDFDRWVPMHYVINTTLQDFEMNLYLNDHNIITHPHARDANAMLTLCGHKLRNAVEIPSTIFRPQYTSIPFSVEIPGVDFSLTLPKWNTNAIFASSRTTDFGRAGNLQVDGSFLYYSETRPEYIDQLKINVVGHQMVFIAFGWVVRHLMTVRDNYFGNFTHFSTLNEYVAKRGRGLSVGDPVELKWREGKSNVFEVTLGVMVEDSVVILPSGLPGYEQPVDPASELGDRMATNSQSLGTCAILFVPELQNQLRTHDYSMEMSLNIAPVTLSVTEGIIHDLAYESYHNVGRQKLQVDGIDILANRLFGPQPRTSTYLCLWEFRIGSIAGVVSTMELRGLSDALTSFRFNFTDASNAPASEFAIPPEPDVTFLKVEVGSIDLAWVVGQTSLQLLLPQGLQFDYNDLASISYKKVSEVRVPEGVLRALLRSGSRRESWFEAASVSFDVGLDIYSSPKGWRETARNQTAFVTAQDSLTRRAWFLYEKTSEQTHSYLHSMFLPKPTLPRQPIHMEPVHRRLEEVAQKARISTYNRFNEIIESDEDERISEADRDARVANSRPVTPLLRNKDLDDGTMSSSDESDNDDLSTTLSDTDSDGVDQVESATKHSAIPSPLLSHYKQIVRRFESHMSDKLSGWSLPLFTLAKDIATPINEENLDRGPSNHSANSPNASGREFVAPNNDNDTRITQVMRSKSIDVLVTPLWVRVMTGILDDLFTAIPSIELIVDSLTKEYLGEISSGTIGTASEETVDVEVSTIRLRVLQSLMAVDESISHLTPISSPTVPLRNSRIVSDLALTIYGLNATFSKTSGSSFASQPNLFRGSLSRFDAHLNVSIFHSLSQLNRTPKFVRQCILILDGSKTVSTVENLHVELGNMHVQFLGKSSPEMVAATIEPLIDLIHESQASYTKKMASSIAARQHQIWSILQSCRYITVDDPLTQTQPSLLVQMGRPGRIRQDPSWKLFLYLRVCLRWLGASHRKAIHQLPFLDPPLSSIQMDDLITTILERLPDWGFELSREESSHLPFLRHCFPTVQPSVDKLRQKDNRLPTISFHSGSLSFSVLEDSDPLDVLGNTLTLGPFHLVYRLKEEIITAIPFKFPKISPTTFRTEPDTASTNHHVLSFVIDNIRFTIHPSFIIFLQHLLSLHGKYLRYSSSASTKSTPANVHPRTDDYLEMFVNLKQMSVQAAVEGMVLEVGLSDVNLNAPVLRAVSGVSRTQPKLRQLISASALLKLSQAYTCVRQAQDKADPFSSNGKDHDTLTRLDFSLLLVQASCRISGELPPVIHGLLTLNSVTLSVPRSALLTYRLIEEWRTQYLPNINAMTGELFSELEKRNNLRFPRTQIKAPIRSLYPSITFQSSVRRVGMSLQVMHGTWFSWDVHHIIGFLRNVTDLGSTRFTFGVQLASQLIRIGARLEGGTRQAAKSIKLALPSFRISGNYDTRQLSCHAIIDHFSLTLKPKYVDDILVVQQNLGTHFYDVLDLIAESRTKKPTSKKPSKAVNLLKYNIAFLLQGFRVGIEAPTTTLALTSAQMTGTAKNDDGFAWDFSVSSLALAMSHHSTDLRPRTEFDRSMRSAYMVLDVKASSAPGITSLVPSTQPPHILRLRVNRMHAVMSPNSIGELGDLIDHIQAEKLLRQEQRALELEEIKNKTKRVIKAFEVRKPTTSSKRSSSSFLDNRSVLIEVADIGVAFPLALRNEIEVDSIGSVPAFLMSIKSATFSVRRYESGHASLGRLSFQFVKQFDQSRSSQFDGDEHRCRNKLLYPGMKADFRSRTSAITRQWQIAADVDGFILNLDPTIVDNVFGLVDVYRKGKERIDRLTATPQIPKMNTEHARAVAASVEASYLAIRTSNVFITLVFHTGALYLCGVEVEDDSPNEGSMFPDVIQFPTFTLSSEYRATPAASKVSGSLEQEQSALIFRSQVHSTINKIKPSILAFLSGFAERIEERLRHRNTEPLISTMSHSSESSDMSSHEGKDFLATDVLNGIMLSFSLRIDSSRLELDCGHDLGVVAALHWESGGFLVTLSPEARTMHFTGSVTGIQVDLRHLKHQAGTVRTGHVDARNLAFSVTYSQTEDTDGDTAHSVSVVVDTEFGAALRFDRLQDILIFKAIYIDRLPGAVSQAPTKSAPTTVKSSGGIPGMTTLVLIRVRHIQLLVDLGHNVASAVIDLEKVLLQSQITGPVTDISLSVAETSLQLEEERPLGGYMRLPDFSFSTIRRSDIRLGMKDGISKMLEVSLTSGNLDIVLQSEKRTLLQYHAEPFDIRIADDWTAMDWNLPPGDRTLWLDFSVVGKDVLAVANLQSAPRIIILLAKLQSDLNAQRAEAGNALSSSSIAQLPKPDSALSQVAEAMIRSARSKLSDSPAFSYTIMQRMKLSLSSLRLALFKSPNDSEMALFQGKDVRAELERTVHSLDTPPSRSLKLAFSSLYLSKYSSLKYRATADELMAVAWLERLLKGASEWTIARVPAMNLEMNSDVEYEGRQEVLQYDLVAIPDENVQSSRSIYVSLNLSLYIWAGALVKGLGVEIDKALAVSGFNKPIVKAAATAVASPPSLHPSTTSHDESNSRATETNPPAATANISLPSSSFEHQETPVRLPRKYYARSETSIDYGTIQQLGEATPDAKAPWLGLKETVPPRVHEYATLPMEVLMKVLLEVYSKQLRMAARKSASNEESVFGESGIAEGDFDLD